MFEFIIGAAAGTAVVVIFPKIYNFLFGKYTELKD
jgi:hypothetical protein